MTVTPVKVPLVGKLQLLGLLVRENGIFWTVLCLVYAAIRYGLRWDISFLQRMMRFLELRWDLPGMSSTAINRRIWDNWDWGSCGEEWTDTSEWKSAMLEHVLHKYVPPGKDVLEIGPGAGRWSEWLQRDARTLTLVDLSEARIALCRSRFAAHSNVAYHTTQGNNLDAVPDAAIDVVWAFDVFVHITPKDTASYLSSMFRVLRPGGRAIIHHARDGGVNGAWRSRMTRELFADLARQQGFHVVVQSDTVDGQAMEISPHHDTITVVEK